MEKKVKRIFVLVLSVIILCSCENFKLNQAGDFGDNSAVSEGVISSESDGVVSEGAVDSEDYWNKIERKMAKEAERASLDSYNYWKELLKNEYDKGEIDYIVNWIKDKDYIDSLSFSNSDARIPPKNKKTKERIQSEKNFTRVNNYLKKEKLMIINYWTSREDDAPLEKRVFFLHRFDMEVTHGNYCLVYAGSKLTKEEEGMNKIVGDYYEKVLFYE